MSYETPAGLSPVWQRFEVGFAQLAAAAFSNNIELLSLPPRGVIHAVNIAHTQPFTGGLIATYTMSVGIASNLTKYADVFNVLQAVSGSAFLHSVVGGVESTTNATSIRVAGVSTVGLLNAATQGTAIIRVLTSRLPA